ncbi:SDR family oxidoreductase [Achromobacter sp. GG226]|uniref:SDR family NAD(P)-dependent oxidoreductase n=1 Tax=Verticiella alkaliphila TaxID=2779529 RepID=UPI001C0B09B6|nr:SDR family oxidoreductase [Verticiella sp. GG226]MBU4611496.1 SDR family oxidoreductase [Verticiella sp. GG226]
MTDPSKALAGRTAIVTGSGQNIGRAIARRLAAAGANVVINGSRNRENVDKVVDEIEAAGGQAIGIMANVGDPGAVSDMVSAAIDRFGAVDIAVSNVGRRRHQPFLDITVNDWREVIETNLNALFYLDSAVLPGMKARGWGRIVHVSGYDGFWGHMPNRAHNITCKAGMHGLTMAMAGELAPLGITCNTLVPGAIDTERDWSQYPNTDRQAKAASIPVRRWGQVDDVADGCLYLVSAPFVNGHALHVNGGERMF